MREWLETIGYAFPERSSLMFTESKDHEVIVPQTA